MINIIKNVVDESIDDPTTYKQYDMFVLIIMAHGRCGSVADGRYGNVDLADVYAELSHEKFMAFRGKPKWIIIEACSGDRELFYYSVTLHPTVLLSHMLKKYFCI